MANRIQELIFLLEEEIEQSPRQRLAGGNKRLVDCDKMLDLLGDLKVVVPEEVRLAQTILLEHKAMLREAESKATEVLARARMESERLIARQTVLSEAQSRGDAIIREAEEKADVLMQESRDYSQTIMEEVQRYLGRYIEMIDETREDIRRNYRGAPKRFYTRANDNESPMDGDESPHIHEEYGEENDDLTIEEGISSADDAEVSPNQETSDLEIPLEAVFTRTKTALLDEDLLRRLE